MATKITSRNFFLGYQNHKGFFLLVGHLSAILFIFLSFQAEAAEWSPDKIPLTISVEGIIGAGKSQCLSYLSTYDTVEIQPEPVEAWQNWDNINLLDLFYQDPCTYGYLFQNYVQLTLLERHLQPPRNNIRIMERSIYSSHHVFQRHLSESLELDEIENRLLTSWFDLLTTGPTHQMHLDLIVYIRVDPLKALERIQDRNRWEERFISLDYLESLEHYHKQWLMQTQIPVLILDGNKPLNQMPEEYEKIVKSMMTMLK